MVSPVTIVKKIIKRVGWLKLIILAFIFMVIFTGISIKVTGKPGFCNSCHIMNDHYDSWAKSTHNEVNCLDCHIEPGLGNYMKGKVNGLAQLVDCVVGRVGTKPSAHVSDKSCLRSGCHDAEKLSSKKLDFNGIKFTHKNHIDKVVDGIRVNCGTCHSHFEGDDHFSVNSKTCFSCHFVKAGDHKPANLDETKCLDCHNIPDKVIERGAVKVNHKEFASYQVSCEESCHKGQVEYESNVTDFSCLSCHSFGNEKGYSSKELHEFHSHGKKVECFACHGDVRHGPTEGHSVASMSKCENCHSDTHNIQQDIFGAERHPVSADDEKILSPMFLTHVECSDCHTQKVKTGSAAVDSYGTVAKAVPSACDRCHKAGTGEKYIPFWQKQIKGLYGRLEKLLEEKTEYVNANPSDVTAEQQKSIEESKMILRSVKADGSWGVHNLKYTEAILNKAITSLNNWEQEE